MVNITNLKSKGIVFKVGIGFLAMAVILWLSPLYIPLTSLGVAQKVVVVSTCILFAEVFFWVGALSTGKEFIEKFKGRFNLKNWKNTSSKNKGE